MGGCTDPIDIKKPVLSPEIVGPFGGLGGAAITVGAVYANTRNS